MKKLFILLILILLPLSSLFSQIPEPGSFQYLQRQKFYEKMKNIFEIKFGIFNKRRVR
jgi:acid phosphatase class B